MYLGGTDLWALHELAFNVVDNSVNLAKRGRCSQLWVTLLEGRTVVIRDDGPGIPVAIHEAVGRPIAELVFTRATGKFDEERNQFMDTFFGVGLSVVNALSANLQVEIRRDGYVWEQHFKAGVPASDLIKGRAMAPQETAGTTLTFTPDFTIFEPNDFQVAILGERLQDLAFLTPGLTITLRDERTRPTALERTFYAENGLVSCVDYLRGDALAVNRPIRGQSDSQVRLPGENPRSIHVEWVCQYTTVQANLEESFASRFKLHKGRAHMYGLRDALVDFVNRYACDTGALVPGDPKLAHEEIRWGSYR
jgi:DNA gyrase subunit B